MQTATQSTATGIHDRPLVLCGEGGGGRGREGGRWRDVEGGREGRKGEECGLIPSSEKEPVHEARRRKGLRNSSYGLNSSTHPCTQASP